MKEMAGAGKDSNGQLLGPRPVHHSSQCNCVITLTVYDQTVLMCIDRQMTGGEMADRRTHQHDFFQPAGRPQSLHRLTSHKGTERKTGQHQRRLRCELLHQSQQILRFTTPFVIHTFRTADATEIET